MTEPQPNTIRIDVTGGEDFARQIRRAIRAQAGTTVQEALGPARRGGLLDRVLWTATGIALGFGLATIAIFVLARDTRL